MYAILEVCMHNLATLVDSCEARRLTTLFCILFDIRMNKLSVHHVQMKVQTFALKLRSNHKLLMAYCSVYLVYKFLMRHQAHIHQKLYKLNVARLTSGCWWLLPGEIGCRVIDLYFLIRFYFNFILTFYF